MTCEISLKLSDSGSEQPNILTDLILSSHTEWKGALPILQHWIDASVRTSSDSACSAIPDLLVAMQIHTDAINREQMAFWWRGHKSHDCYRAERYGDFKTLRRRSTFTDNSTSPHNSPPTSRIEIDLSTTQPENCVERLFCEDCQRILRPSGLNAAHSTTAFCCYQLRTITTATTTAPTQIIDTVFRLPIGPSILSSRACSNHYAIRHCRWLFPDPTSSLHTRSWSSPTQ